MNTTEEKALATELAELRAALHTLAPPPADEARLRAAFQAAQRAPTDPAAVTVPVRASRRYLAAAAVALVAGGLVVFGAQLAFAPSSSPPVAAPPPAAAASVAAFQPLSSSPGFAPSGSYSVVRVRIPLAALALVPGTEEGGTVEADLLVGEDGLARGIRFTQADTLLVSVQD